MKLKYLRLIQLYSKLTSSIVIAQCVFMNTLLAAESNAQEKSLKDIYLTIGFKQSTLKEVFDGIESMTEFEFSYYRKDLPDVKLTIDRSKRSLAQTLYLVAEQAGLKFKRVDENIFVSLNAGSKVKKQSEPLIIEVAEISGTVTDENGEGLPGVNVLIKGTTQGTVTDINGNYVLSVPDGATTLVFSYVGYVQEEVQVSGRTAIDIQLVPDISTLTEVVVIGYGTQEKKEVTGSVAQVEGDQLTKAPIATLTNTLTGRLPGLTIRQTSAEPGREGTEVLVRGRSTFGNNAALVVIDGVANRDGIDRIDPNDIESVTILKDAAAAIYGAQAANGVILITTKRGKSGKPQFSYTFNQGFNSPIRLQDRANGHEYAQLANLRRWGNSDWDPNFERFATDEEIENLRNGTTPSYNWQDIAYKDYFTQQSHNISVRGGGDKVKYFISARYFDQGTLFEDDNVGGNTQYNIRSNIDFDVNENLEIGLDLAGRQQDRAIANQRDRIFSNALLTPPTVSPFINGDPSLPSAGRADQNPLAITRGSGYNEDETNVYNGTIKFNYKLPYVDGLAFGGFAAIDINTNFNKSFFTPYTFYTLDGNDEVVENKSASTPRLDQSYNRNRQLTYNIRSTYVRTIGEHNIDVLVQFERQTARGDNFGGFNALFLSPAVDQLSAGSPDRNDTGISGNASERARLNYSGRINYNYGGKYLAQFIFRYDGSEVFEPGERFGFFPGVSLGWVISDESFFNNIDFVSNLKLRASWGELGNDRIPRFQYLSTFGFGRNLVVNGATATGVRERGSANPGVTWETSETLNLGLDAALLDGKVNVELDVFKVRTRDILATPDETQPDYTGLPSLNRNIGTHENRGFEVSSYYRDKIGEFNFKIGGNIAFARNEVINIDEPDREFDYQNQEGRPLGSGLWYHAIGIFRTQADLDTHPQLGEQRLGDVIIQDTNEDGVIDGSDRIRLDQTATPEWTYGITGEVSWKNFDLNMLWQGARGGLRRLQMIFDEGNNGLTYLLNNSWSPDNPNSEWPRLLQGQNTDFYHFETNYIRLKTLEIGYSLPVNLVKRIGLERARVYLSGFNLLTFDKLSDIGLTDPEQPDVFGRDFPNLKTVNIGANITF